MDETLRNAEGKGLEINFAVDSVASEKHPEWNEDSHYANPETGVFAVFDGVSKSDDGKLSAELASTTLKESDTESTQNMSDDGRRQNMMNFLKDANNRLLTESSESGAVLQTTATVAYVARAGDGYKLLIGNVGDCRAYKFSGGSLEQVTIDDSLIRRQYSDPEKQRQVQSRFSNLTDPETLSTDERAIFQKRAVITDCLGLSGMKPSIYESQAQSGDSIILTSDGIHDNLTDAEIEKYASMSSDPEVVKKSIMEAAISRSKQRGIHFRAKRDDMTVMAIMLGEKPAINDEKPEVATSVEPVKEEAKPEFNLSKGVAEAKSFDELFDAIDMVDGVEGTQVYYTSRQLISIIEKVRNGEREVKSVTREAGLRNKVKELLEIESERTRIIEME